MKFENSGDGVKLEFGGGAAGVAGDGYEGGGGGSPGGVEGNKRDKSFLIIIYNLFFQASHSSRHIITIKADMSAYSTQSSLIKL